MTRFIDCSDLKSRSASEVTNSDPKAGKFVQLRGPDSEMIIFAPADMCKYHSDIVSVFAAMQGLDLSRNSKGEAIGFVDPEWRILGGGKAIIDMKTRTLSFGGSSQAFGPFQSKGFAERLKSLEQFSNFAVQVDD